MFKKKFHVSPHVKILLPRKMRLRFTNWLLDWAEKQKPASDSNWFLSQLQLHRKSQRDLGKSFLEFRKPPTNTEIKFLGFRLVEVFHYEDFDKVRFGLLSLFPDLEQKDGDFIKTFGKDNDALRTMWWSPVGTLFGDTMPGLGTRVTRKISGLSPYIECIQVDAQKILPSLIVVSFSVHLEDEATTKLLELHSQQHLGLSTLKSIYFGKYPLLGIALSTPDAELKEKISSFISDLHENVERIIKSYVQGHFLTNTYGRRHLPSIEIFSISGTRSHRQSFNKWANDARNWWLSYGFSFFRGQLFGNSELMFNWRESRREDAIGGNKIIVIPEEFLNENSSVRHKLDFYCNDIIPSLSVIELLDDLLGSLEGMRRQIFDAISRKKYNPSRYIQIYQKFQILVRILQRLSLEFKQNFIHGRFIDISNLIEVDIDKKRNNSRQMENISFPKSARERVDFLNNLLLEHIDFVDKALSRHIEFLNTDAVYRLQKQTFFLTIIATLVGGIGVLVNYSELKELFLNFIETMKMFFSG